MIRQASITSYLRAVGLLALEVAARPALLPLFLRILQLMPATLAELAGQHRRIAA